MRRALVLAGGGYVASSWETGLIAGMAEAGLDVRNADLLVGTSAGARVALDLGSGRPLDDFYRRRTDATGRPAGPARGPSGPGPMLDRARIAGEVAEAKRAGGSTADILRRYGALALAAAPAAGSDLRAIVAAQLPVEAWPERRILITAVCAETGERRAFDRESGIDVVDAVIASTASFGAAPLLFEGRHYVDGGYYSSDNADLAIECERVLIVALRSPPQAMRLVPIEAGVEILRAAGAGVEVIHPDEATVAAMDAAGGQMNPAAARPAALAGRQQGLRAADRIAALWRQG